MERYKYPKTPHLSYSTVTDRTDKKLSDESNFTGKTVAVALKMDGENTTIYSDGFVHARSINSAAHQSRSWVKAYAQTLQLPEEFRICGENMWARHTIEYNDLKSYFLAFSIWVGDQCAEWKATKGILNELSVEMVPVI